jgi:phosphatidylserine decarboxylase
MFAAEQHNLKDFIDECFVGGTVYQGYLSPWYYHQWHSPVAGIIEKSYMIPGNYFLQNPSLDLENANNYDNSQVFLSCTATRHVFIIETLNPALGKVAVIEIGMVEVSSCIPTVKEGEFVSKGQCIGRF